MKNKIFSARFSGMNLRFFLFFLLFAYAPLFIFSVIGYLLNKQLMENVYQQDMHRCVNLWKQKYQLMTNCNRDVYITLDRIAKNENEFSRFLTFVPQQKERQIVGFVHDRKVRFMAHPGGDQDRIKDHLLVKKEKLHFSLKDSSFYKLVPIDSANSVVVRYPMNLILQKFCNLQKEARVFLISLTDGVAVSNHELRLFKNTSESARQKAKRYISKLSDNRHWISASISIEPGWILLYQRPTKILYAPLLTFLIEIILANLLLGILLFIAAMLIARSIARPIKNLAVAANKISTGELERQVPIEGRDEIRDLAIEFERMRQKLLESYQDLEQKIEQRTKALREAQSQVSHQEKMASMGILAAGVAHEIGNPLTSISSIVQVIKRKVKDPALQEYLNTILENIDRISRIVRELVDFSRPTGSEFTYVNVNDVIQNAVGIIKYDRRAKKVNLKLQLAEDVPNLFLVPDQLLQVILNMLINALDALKDGQGTIEIRSELKGDHVLISIKDNGQGIAPEHLNKIFEPFFTTKKVGQGTGLGLSVSYGIIRNFKGKIDVKSELGKGSEFIIYLPLNERGEQSQ